MAAWRLWARKSEVVSGTLVSEARLTTALPRCWSRFFSGEKCSIDSTTLSPTTMSASPRMIGSTSLGMSPPKYWLSASVLTMTSAPSLRLASSPAGNAAASPLWFVRRAMWTAPSAGGGRAGPPLVVREAAEVVAARGPGDLAGPVRRAALDDQPRHLVDAGHLPRQV